MWRTHLNVFADSFVDPSLHLLDICVHFNETKFAASLDQLVGLDYQWLEQWATSELGRAFAFALALTFTSEDVDGCDLPLHLATDWLLEQYRSWYFRPLRPVWRWPQFLLDIDSKGPFPLLRWWLWPTWLTTLRGFLLVPALVRSLLFSRCPFSCKQARICTRKEWYLSSLLR